VAASSERFAEPGLPRRFGRPYAPGFVEEEAGMAEHPNAQRARESMEAFNQGDLAAFADSMHEDVVWHAPGRNRFAGDFHGKAAVLARFKEQAEGGVRLRFVDVHDILGSDDHVVALLHIAFTGPGGEVTNPSVFVMHMREGKIGEFWAMNDRQDEVDRIVGG
jgi:ketosteroid isomerase-like protein